MMSAPVTLWIEVSVGHAMTIQDKKEPTIECDPGSRRESEQDERGSGKCVCLDSRRISIPRSRSGTRERVCDIFSIGFRNRSKQNPTSTHPCLRLAVSKGRNLDDSDGLQFEHRHVRLISHQIVSVRVNGCVSEEGSLDRSRC
jgi:hypothetical protein